MKRLAMVPLAMLVSACCFSHRPSPNASPGADRSFRWGAGAVAPPAIVVTPVPTLTAILALDSDPRLSVAPERRQDLRDSFKESFFSAAGVASMGVVQGMGSLGLGRDPLTATVFFPAALAAIYFSSPGHIQATITEVRVHADGSLVHAALYRNGEFLTAVSRDGKTLRHYQRYEFPKLGASFIAENARGQVGADGYETGLLPFAAPEVEAVFARYEEALAGPPAAAGTVGGPSELSVEAIEWFGVRAVPMVSRRLARSGLADQQSLFVEKTCQALIQRGDGAQVPRLLEGLVPASGSATGAAIGCLDQSGTSDPTRLAALLTPFLQKMCSEENPAWWHGLRLTPERFQTFASAEVARCSSPLRKAAMLALFDQPFAEDAFSLGLRQPDPYGQTLSDAFETARPAERAALLRALRDGSLSPDDASVMERILNSNPTMSEVALAVALSTRPIREDRKTKGSLFDWPYGWRLKLLEMLDDVQRSEPEAADRMLADLRKTLPALKPPMNALALAEMVLLGDAGEALPALRALPAGTKPAVRPQSVGELVREALVFAGCQPSDIAGARLAALSAPHGSRGPACTSLNTPRQAGQPTSAARVAEKESAPGRRLLAIVLYDNSSWGGAHLNINFRRTVAEFQSANPASGVKFELRGAGNRGGPNWYEDVAKSRSREGDGDVYVHVKFTFPHRVGGLEERKRACPGLKRPEIVAITANWSSAYDRKDYSEQRTHCREGYPASPIDSDRESRILLNFVARHIDSTVRGELPAPQ